MEPAWGCRNELFNAKTLWLADKADWKTAGLTYARLTFLRETPADCARVFRAYRTGAGEAPAGSPGAVLPGWSKAPGPSVIGRRFPVGVAGDPATGCSPPTSAGIATFLEEIGESTLQGQALDPGVHGPLTSQFARFGDRCL